MEQETKDVNRFELKLETKLLTKIGKLLTSIEGMTEEQAIKLSQVAVMDSANVCMIIGRTEEAKRVLSRFTTQEQQESIKVPELEYSTNKNVSKSKYSNEYLKKIFELMTLFETTIISVAHDYPATLENEHFKIILAPRVGDD